MVDFEGVGEGELFAEPDDAFGLGAGEVVDCEDHDGWGVKCGL